MEFNSAFKGLIIQTKCPTFINLHTFIAFLLHVSLSHSPSSGRTFCALNLKSDNVMKLLIMFSTVVMSSTIRKVAGSIPDGVIVSFH